MQWPLKLGTLPAYLGRIGPMDVKDPPIQPFLINFYGSRSSCRIWIWIFSKWICIWIEIGIFLVVKSSYQKGSGTSGYGSLFQTGSERWISIRKKIVIHVCLPAIKSGTQAELSQLISRNFGSATLLPLQAPPLYIC